MKILKTSVYILAIFAFSYIDSHSQARRSIIEKTKNDPRGKPELTVCSQNLNNFGDLKDMTQRFKNYSREKRTEKIDNLIARFRKANCDIIAVQELIGQRQERYESALRELAAIMNQRTGRSFSWVIGTGKDVYSRVAYLIAKDRAKLLHTVSYSRLELPRIDPRDRPTKFLRAPLEIQVQTKPRDNSTPKVVRIINVHFKSKSGGSRDPARLDWELTRMEMAEALRKIVNSRHEDALDSPSLPLLLVGDRNSFHDSASAKILNGVITLDDFKNHKFKKRIQKSKCRVGSKGTPMCYPGVTKPQKLFSVLLNDPQASLAGGTHYYRGKRNWLDDILIDRSSMIHARAKPYVEGDYSSGVVFEPRYASDHALAWVKLNW